VASPTITRFRGDTKADLFTIKRSNGQLVDITGFTFRMTVNDLENPSTGTPGNILMAITGVITNATKGEVEFAPTALQADQTPGSYFYDVEMTDVASRITTIAKGSYVFTQDISK
jgi:hypothetical protein